MLRHPILSLSALLLLGGLCGCGNVGDLYLPEDKAVTQTAQTQQTES